MAFLTTEPHIVLDQIVGSTGFFDQLSSSAPLRKRDGTGVGASISAPKLKTIHGALYAPLSLFVCSESIDCDCSILASHSLARSLARSITLSRSFLVALL